MNKIKKWFSDLRNKKVSGYICPIFPHEQDLDVNSKVLNRMQVKYIKFRIPFLDPESHVVEMAFIPKSFQSNLDFLSRLIYVLPIDCFFKKRILQGFRPEDYDLIELWTKSVFDEIRDQNYQKALEEDKEMIEQEQQRAAEALAKVEEKRRKQQEEKEAKAAERERKKQEEKERKLAEREAKKKEKELEKQKNSKK